MTESIYRTKLSRLKNETHAQFHENGTTLVETVTTTTFGIEPLYALYRAAASVILAGLLSAVFSTASLAQSVSWKKNFGGIKGDYYQGVTAVSDGIVAVGYSGATSFGNGDWAGVTGKGSIDAIIVKYNNSKLGMRNEELRNR